MNKKCDVIRLPSYLIINLRVTIPLGDYIRGSLYYLGDLDLPVLLMLPLELDLEPDLDLLEP